MNAHPTAQRYKSYEWAYPASVYVDLIQSVGFALVAVIPQFYDKSLLITSRPSAPEDLDTAALTRLTDAQLTGPGGTVELFWDEVDSLRRGATGHWYRQLFT